MFRAFVIAAVVAALSGCGEEPEPMPPAPDTSVHPNYYAEWAGPWEGEARDTAGSLWDMEFPIAATLEVTDSGVDIVVPCGTGARLVSYYVGADRVYLSARETFKCNLPTPCGEQAFRLSSASFITHGTTSAIVFVAFTGDACGQKNLTVTISAGMHRPQDY